MIVKHIDLFHVASLVSCIVTFLLMHIMAITRSSYSFFIIMRYKQLFVKINIKIRLSVATVAI